MSTLRRSARRAAQRGMTLIEVMIAMTVLLLGVLGLFSAQVVASQQNSGAVKQNRATVIARDVLAAARRWDYTDARLADDPANDALVFDSGRSSDEPDLDAFELDLNQDLADNAQRGTANLIDLSALDLNGDGAPDFQRYLSLAPLMDGANKVGLRLAATVVWREGSSWRRVTLYDAKYDPTGNTAAVPGL